MNLPNKLTLARIILIPAFVFFLLASFIPFSKYIALLIFIVASLTDLIDGKIARKRNLVTNFGKFMDPLADKLLVVTALLCLLVIDGGKRVCGNQIVGLIAILIIVAREFIISGFRLVASDLGRVIAASYWGKFKTAFTMVSIGFMIIVTEVSSIDGLEFVENVSMVLFWISVTLTVVSLVDYIVKNLDIVTEGLYTNSSKKAESGEEGTK